MVKMSCLFQHLIKSIGYETLKQVQGDKITIATQSPRERELIRISISVFGWALIVKVHVADTGIGMTPEEAWRQWKQPASARKRYRVPAGSSG
jgi:hypothetical protein